MGYGVVSRVFHWLTVVLVAVMLTAGVIMTQDIPRSIQNPLFILHKGLGVVVLLVVALRIAWRVVNPPPPAPADLPPIQRRAAELVHVGLYILLLVMAISGYVRVTAGGFPIELLNAIGVPPLLSKDEALANVAKAVHAAVAWALVGLILVHVAAALYHALVKRDGVFSRMWPPFSA